MVRPVYSRLVSGPCTYVTRPVEIWGELCACIDLDTERREKEKDASYI